MSDTTQTSPGSAICPGARSLFPNNGDKHYLRFAFQVYWPNRSPSAEILYATRHDVQLTPDGIAALEADALTALQASDKSDAIAAVWLGYTGIEMSDAQAAAVGWRMLAPTAA